MSRPYNARVRVGNWNEEMAGHEERMKEFMRKRENGELEVDKSQKVIASSTRRVQLTPVAGDGCLHFNDVIMLRHVATQEALAVLPPPPMTADPVIDAVGSSNAEPSVRTAFRIVPAVSGDHDKDYDGPVLFADSTFHLVQAFPPASDDDDAEQHPTALFTERISLFGGAAKRSPDQQGVQFVKRLKNGTTWCFRSADPEFAVESEGEPVPVGQDVMLFSAVTNLPLARSGKTVPSEFGSEAELSCHKFLTPRKLPGPETIWSIQAGEAQPQ